MDDRRFDSLTKSLAGGASRRAVLKGILGLGSAAVVGGTVLERDADAARRPAPTPTPVKCPGQQTPVNGVCTCPDTAPNKCGPDCCTSTRTDAVPGPSTHTECCDSQCCAGTCYGEELCCPTNSTSSGGDPTHFVCNGPNGKHCCESDQQCCLIDGCCETVCHGGSVGSSFCCAEGNFCPSSGRHQDVCCQDGERCCGAGTDSNRCIEDTEGACCADADCPSGQICKESACVPNDPCGDACTSEQVCIDEECLCQAGFYTEEAECVVCPAGYYSDLPGQISCDPCDLNTYQPSAGMTSCLSCPEGTYTENVGQTTCQECNCALGTMPEICGCTAPCQPGYGPDNGQCVACPPGSQSPDGYGCTPCQMGYFASSSATTLCEPCYAGTYAALTGTATCQDCPAGTYADVSGSASCAVCACGSTCDPSTGQCPGIIGVGGACEENSDCTSNVCGCGSPAPLPACMCRFDTCWSPGTECSSGYGAISCCSGDCLCTGDSCFCTPVG